MRNTLSALKSFARKGTNRSRFFRGQVDKYTWVDIGSSYLPSENPCGISLRPTRNEGADSDQEAENLGVLL
jgi:hypothetical protein